LGESIDHPNGHAVKTLESKETKAQKEKTVTHNSVFAAHRLKNAVPRLAGRHFPFRLFGIPGKVEESLTISGSLV